jgi:hypothetical protein
VEADSGRPLWEKSARDFLSAERRGFSALSAANWTAVRLIEGRPANAGQTLILARHHEALTTHWIPSKREHHAGQFLYVPLPLSTALEWSGTAAELETFWKLPVNHAACAPELETFWKLLGNLPRPDCLGRQMADTPSVLSAALTQWPCDRKRHACDRVSDISFMFHYRFSLTFGGLSDSLIETS